MKIKLSCKPWITKVPTLLQLTKYFKSWKRKNAYKSQECVKSVMEKKRHNQLCPCFQNNHTEKPTAARTITDISFIYLTSLFLFKPLLTWKLNSALGHSITGKNKGGSPSLTSCIMSSGRTKLFSELGNGRISDSCCGAQKIEACYIQGLFIPLKISTRFLVTRLTHQRLHVIHRS